MTTPAVSVIVPVFNGERYLAQALDSVLEQTYPDLELIVVDDGSTDATPDIISRFGSAVRSVHQPNAGTAAALNRGIDLARGSLLSFLDADDLWVPDKLRWQLDALRANPGIDLVFGHMRQFHSPDLVAAERAAITCSQQAMPGISTGTLLVPRQAFNRVGPFSTRWAVGEFMDWYGRAQDAGLRQVVLPEVVALRRLHSRSRERAADVDYARIAREALRRRRQGEAEVDGSEPSRRVPSTGSDGGRAPGT